LGTSEVGVECIQCSFLCSPKKSARHFSRELQISKSVVHTVLHAYNLHLLKNITEEDEVLCFDLATCVLDQLAQDADYLQVVEVEVVQVVQWHGRQTQFPHMGN
jgi:hypothetical protein